MNTHSRLVAGLAIIALIGCADSITEPDRAFDLNSSAVAGLDTCAGDFNLTTQAEVDAFNCTNVAGHLNIGPSADITNVAALSGLVSVDGSLSVLDNLALANLDGLSSLMSVGTLGLIDNTALLNVEGLSSLLSIGGVLYIYGNTLTDLDGLSSLESVREIDIQRNSLTRIELPALDSVFNFSVGGNGNLKELNLPRIRYVDHLLLAGNGALTDLNLPSLVEVGFLETINNAALQNLDGLGSLVLAEWIYLRGNAALENVDALASIASLRWLDVFNNPSLTMCACGLYSLLATGGVSDEVRIENNAPGCNSPSEVIAEPCDECGRPGFGPVISVDVPSLEWSFVEGDSEVRQTTIAVSAYPLPCSELSVIIDDVTSTAGWLDVQLTSSTVPPEATATVTVDPSGLAAGTHVAEFTLSSPDSRNAVEIRLVVNVAPRPGGLPVIHTSVPSISWSIVEGDVGGLDRGTSLWITSGGEGALAGLTASVAYAHEPSDWVDLWMGGLVERGRRMTVNPRTSNLPVGRHVAEVAVSSPTASNTVEIRVVVDVREVTVDSPSGLTATNADMDVTLVWVDNSDNEDEFRIERKGVPHGAWIEIKKVPAGTTSFVDRPPTPDWYTYRVRACTAAGCSGYAATNKNLPVPTPPKLEFRPANRVGVGLSVGGGSASGTIWLVNVGGVPQHWFGGHSDSPIGWKVEPRAGVIPPQGAMTVKMTAFAPSSWGGPRPYSFNTFMVVEDPISVRIIGGIGMDVDLY